MKKIKVSLIQYLSSIIYLMNNLINEKTPSCNFRFCRTKFSRRHGHDICVVQVKGKGIYPEFTADEIINTPKLLCEFSPDDVVVITKIAMDIENSKRSNLYCVREIQMGKESRGKFVVQKIGDKNYQLLDSVSLAANADLISKFSSIDAYNFGYSNGVKEMRDLFQDMKEAKMMSKRKSRMLKKIKNLFIV